MLIQAGMHEQQYMRTIKDKARSTVKRAPQINHTK